MRKYSKNKYLMKGWNLATLILLESAFNWNDYKWIHSDGIGTMFLDAIASLEFGYESK